MLTKEVWPCLCLLKTLSCGTSNPWFPTISQKSRNGSLTESAEQQSTMTEVRSLSTCDLSGRSIPDRFCQPTVNCVLKLSHISSKSRWSCVLPNPKPTTASITIIGRQEYVRWATLFATATIQAFGIDVMFAAIVATRRGNVFYDTSCHTKAWRTGATQWFENLSP